MSKDPQVTALLLDIARELRERPETWTKDTLARDANGCSVTAVNPLATCWCLLGHVTKRASPLPDGCAIQDAMLARLYARIDEDEEDLSCWNDEPHRTALQVAELCEEAAV